MDSVGNDAPVAVSGAEALESLRVAVALNESVATGRKISLH